MSRSFHPVAPSPTGSRSSSPYSQRVPQASSKLNNTYFTTRTRSSSESSASSSSSSSSSSASTPIGESLLPPFYNRPLAPLPPSPSFTSLLRPPFTPSRPTTPESSDSEAATSSRIAQAAPRAAPKVPTYEYYGFVLYLTSSLAFFVYILWSYLPAPILHHFGIHYYYNRWWSLAVPSYLVMTVVYIYVALASYNTGHLTRDLKSLENIVDEVGKIAVVEIDESRHRYSWSHWDLGERYEEPEGITSPQESSIPIVNLHDYEESYVGVDMPSIPSPSKPPSSPTKSKKRRKRRQHGSAGGSLSDRDAGSFDAPDEHEYPKVMWKDYWSTGTDAVMDIPIGGVCEVLYGEGRDMDEW